MSAYSLQKMIRDFNRDPGVRQQFLGDPRQIFPRYELTDAEQQAVLARDYGALYRLGVHGLLLRPFSIIHQVPEPDYLAAIRQKV